MSRKGKIWTLIAVVVLAPVVVPWFTLPRAKSAILHSLQASLGRGIQADSVHLDLFPRPGVELDGVRLAEDPAFGLEDMVMADSATASFRLMALLRGHLVFSRVHLENASINLVRNQQGEWNVAALLNRAVSLGRRATRTGEAERAAAARLPYLDWSHARVNFKLEQTKTHLYLDQVDGSLARESGDWRLQARFVPERSDLRLSNTGEVRVDGRWHAGAASFQDQPFELSVSLRDSYLAGSSALLAGHDAGLHGIVNARLEVRGTGRQMSISGSAAAQSVRRWDLLPPPAAVRASFAATYDPAADRLTLRGVGDPGWRHFRLSGTVDSVFTAPQAALELDLRHFDAADLLPLALALKSHLPADLRAGGSVDGSAHIALRRGEAMPTGSADFRFSRMELRSGATSLQVPAARLQWDGRHLQVPAAAASLRSGGGSTPVELGAALDRRGFELTFSSPTLDSGAAAGLAHLLGVSSPWPAAIRGEARAAFRLASSWPQLRNTQWSGTARFSEASFDPPGGSGRRLTLRPLVVSVGGASGVEAQFRLAALPVAGTLGFNPGGLDLRVNATAPVEAAAVWELLRPRRPDLVQRVLGDVLGAAPAVPAWLLPLHAKAALDFGQLDWHGIRVHLRMQLQAGAGGWSSPSLAFTSGGGSFLGEGKLAGTGYQITGRVAAAAPLRLGALLASTPYAGRLSGTLSGTVALTRPLTGGDLRQLDATGDFLLRDGSLATTGGPWRFQQCRGHFALHAGAAAVSELECRRGGRAYHGSASVSFADPAAPRVAVILTGGGQTLHLTGGAPAPVTSRIPR